jgi:hypothetical protein
MTTTTTKPKTATAPAPAHTTETPTETAIEVIDNQAAIIPEIDGLEDEEIGEAVLKQFVPGSIFYDYQTILKNKKREAKTPAETMRAVYEAQVWLLCQVYELLEPDGKKRPLGLEDVSFMGGEQLAGAVGGLMTVDLTVNFLDQKNSLETSWHFEVVETGQRFRVKKLSVEKGIEVQSKSSEDPSGIELNKWLITERITLNGEPITMEMFEEVLNFEVTVLLSNKINFLLTQSLPEKTSFAIRGSRSGRTQT